MSKALFTGFALALACAAQTISFQASSGVPTIAAGSAGPLTLGIVTSSPSGIGVALNSLDSRVALTLSNSCSGAVGSLVVNTPATINVCVSTTLPRGSYWFFFQGITQQGSTFGALPLSVTPAGSVTLSSSTVSFRSPSTSGPVTVSVSGGATIQSAVASLAQGSAGNWLSLGSSCQGQSSCQTTVVANPANLLAPTPGYTYLGKITFTATDGTVAEELTQYTYEPANETSITITSPASFTGYAGQPFTVTLAASGGTPPYTWTASGLPSGLNISSAGVISGQVSSAVSSQPVTVTVQDSLGETQTQNITLSFQSATNFIPGQIFPHVAADGQWQTDFIIMNTSTAPVSFTLKLHPDSGTTIPVNSAGTITAVTQLVGTVAARGTVFYTTEATADDDGWAELDSAVPLSGVAVFHESNNQASVLMSAPITTFTVPFDSSTPGEWFTTGTSVNGLAIANADPAHTAQVTCTAYDNTGTKLAGGLTVPSIPASGHTAFVLQGTAPFASVLANAVRGQLACTSTTEVGVVDLRANGGTVSTLPVVANQ